MNAPVTVEVEKASEKKVEESKTPTQAKTPKSDKEKKNAKNTKPKKQAKPKQPAVKPKKVIVTSRFDDLTISPQAVIRLQRVQQELGSQGMGPMGFYVDESLAVKPVKVPSAGTWVYRVEDISFFVAHKVVQTLRAGNKKLRLNLRDTDASEMATYSEEGKNANWYQTEVFGVLGSIGA